MRRKPDGEYINKIKDALATGDMTSQGVASFTGLSVTRVRGLLYGSQRSSASGIFKIDRDRNNPLWSLKKPAVKPIDRGSKVAAPYKPPFKQITLADHDLYQAKNLALEIRK